VLSDSFHRHNVERLAGLFRLSCKRELYAWYSLSRLSKVNCMISANNGPIVKYSRVCMSFAVAMVGITMIYLIRGNLSLL
jgi:hypothetical protein